jgi:drug/metabolite transporter (DMT)-like permease
LKLSQQFIAVLQAVFVTILWASSWVFIKLGLNANLPALTFAGLRYTLAFLCLTPFVLLNANHRASIRSLARQDWLNLALLGVVLYTLTQGAQFLSLAYLPAAMASLLLNLTTIIVGLLGILFLREHPSIRQWAGIFITIAGFLLYFFPFGIQRLQIVGICIALGGVISNAASSLLGRKANRSGEHSPLIITFVSMGIGSVLLLVIGITFQGFGELDVQGWLIIAWLALINTAFAFTLWNQTLRTLSAVESSIVNSLMMPQIAILAFIFLGESLSIKEIIGLTLVGIGVLVVQMQRR